MNDHYDAQGEAPGISEHGGGGPHSYLIGVGFDNPYAGLVLGVVDATHLWPRGADPARRARHCPNGRSPCLFSSHLQRAGSDQ